jgi:uncharacterized protein YcbK (DUF882 family)
MNEIYSNYPELESEEQFLDSLGDFLTGFRRTVTFPSGESLPIITGPEGPGEEHYDPNKSDNPLLDTSGANRSKRLSTNFTVDELARSGGKRFNMARIDPKLVQCLQAIREYVGKPVRVTSGYRSSGYNVEIYRKRGQKPTKSQHSSGRAADIKIAGMTGIQIAKIAVDACGCNIGVGIGANYAHIDVRGRWAKWTYFGDRSTSARLLREIENYRRAKCQGTPQSRPQEPLPPPTSPAVEKPGSAAVSGLQGPFGTLIVAGPPQLRFRYQFTAGDALWIARMITGEAGGRDNKDNEAVIWAMFNRYAFFTHKYYATFTQFIRAYSTPLQPYLRNCNTVRHHMKGSRFVRLDGTLNNRKCPDLPKGQLKRHLRLQRTPWNQLPAGARALAERAVKGALPNPICTASEFASTYIIFRRRNKRKPSHEEWRRYTTNFKRSRKFKWIGEKPGLNQKKNAFFSRTLRVLGSSQRYADLPCDTVRVVPGS